MIEVGDNDWRFNIKMRTPNAKCEDCQKPLYRRPGEMVGGRHFFCKDCRLAPFMRSDVTRRLISERLSGREISEAHKEAISKARIALFNRIGRIERQDGEWEFARWCKSIHKRDNYACQVCKATGKIMAHHILSWKDYPELRFELENGITLCVDCYHKLHRGKTRNNPQGGVSW